MGYSKPFKPNRSNLPNFYFPSKPIKQTLPKSSPPQPQPQQFSTAKQMKEIARIIDSYVKKETHTTKRAKRVSRKRKSD